MNTWGVIITVTIALQLTLAGHVPTAKDDAILTVAQKRYNFFDYVLKFTNEIARQELLQMVGKHSLMLIDYREWWKAHQDNKNYDKKTYESLSEEIELVVRDEENLQKDKSNCELQRKLQDDYFAMELKRTQLKNSELNEIWLRHKDHSKPISVDTLESMLTTFFDGLTKETRDLLRDLSEGDKQQNEALIKWCQKFLDAKDLKAQIEIFNELTEIFEEELEMETKAENLNCRLQSQMEWARHMIRAAIENIWLF